ncbi:MAG: SsrA-binding protein SmpB [Acidobacteriota bacterium]
MSGKEAGSRDLARNRQAFHNYDIVDRYEAGMVLLGPEVKSLRAGKVQLRDAFARIEDGELWLYDCHISPYAQHTHLTLTPIDPLRRRKLLMHRQEIHKLIGKVEEKGLTLVPLRVYLKNGRLKIELALARGRRTYDKRDKLREKEMAREQRRALKER